MTQKIKPTVKMYKKYIINYIMWHLWKPTNDPLRPREYVKQEIYDLFENKGFTREQIDNALFALVRDGYITITDLVRIK